MKKFSKFLYENNFNVLRQFAAFKINQIFFPVVYNRHTSMRTFYENSGMVLFITTIVTTTVL